MSGALPEILPTYPDGETEGPVWHRCPPDPDCPYCQKAAGAAPLDWSFVGNVYCISLKTRNDRVERVSKEFHRTGLCQHVIFYRPEKHPKKGIIGSWESHRAVAMDALNRNLETALVFEDDVLFLRKITSALLAQVASTMRALPANWHIYYLGHWPVEAWFIRSNLLRTRSACAHAYIISQHTMRWLRDHPYGTPGIAMTKIIGRALDSAFSRLPGTYAIFPMLATQSISPSDNFNYKPKPKTKLKHLVTRSRYRETLLSKLMRPFEMIVAALSPFFWLRHKLRNRPPAEGPGAAAGKP